MSAPCLEKALTTRRIQTAGECVVAQFLPANAYAVRDAFVKTIYDQLFCWIVEKINAAIYKPPKGAAISGSSSVPDVRAFPRTPGCTSPTPGRNGTPVDRWRNQSITRSTTCASIDHMVDGEVLGRQDSSAGPGRISIGVLDIFGFENFNKNR